MSTTNPPLNPLVLPLILRNVARLCTPEAAQNLRLTCKHNHAAILPLDLLEAQFSTLYHTNPIDCWNWMAAHNNLPLLRRLLKISPSIASRALFLGIHSESLRLATAANHTETVSFLLSLIPKPYAYWAPTEAENSSLLIAAQKGHIEILSLLVPHVDRNCSRLTYESARSGHRPAVQYFLSYYKDTPSFDDALKDGMYGAISGNQLDIIQFLIDSGVRDQPFVYDCIRDVIDWHCVEVFEVLVDNEFQVEEDHLKLAVESQHEDMIEMVLNAGDGDWDQSFLKEMASQADRSGDDHIGDLIRAYVD